MASRNSDIRLSVVVGSLRPEALRNDHAIIESLDAGGSSVPHDLGLRLDNVP
jgi:hypothetical protein